MTFTALPSLRRPLEGRALVAGWITIGVGALALAGWVSSVPALTRLVPGWTSMRITTALSFMLSGAALVGLRRPHAGARIRRLALAAAALVCLGGLWSLYEYAYGVASLERRVAELILGGERARERLSPVSAVCFVLGGAALLGLRTSGALARVAQAGATLVMLAALLVSIIYAYGDVALHAVAPLSTMAAPSAFGFLALSAGVLFAWGEDGPMNALAGNGLGSVLGRRALPLAIGLPLLAGWVTLIGDRSGVFKVEFAMALVALMNAAISTGLVFASALWLNRIDARRAASEAHLEQLNQTLEKRVEERTREVRAAHQALTAVTRQLSAAQRITRVGSWELDAARRTTTWSDEMYRLMGLELSSTLPSRDELERLFAKSWTTLNQAVDRTIETGFGYELEFELQRADGETAIAVARGEAVRDASGKVQGVVGTLQDVTELKRSEQELSRALERVRKTTRELERSNQELEQFAYVASHDLQEPLRAVAGCGQILMRRYGHGQLEPAAVDLIRHMVEGAARMQALILDLLAFSRVGARGHELCPIDAGEALRRALDQLEGAIAESRATVAAGPLPRVKGDLEQLTQLFQNLMSNAIKYRGPAPVRIEVGAEPNGVDHHFVVRDNGIGIESQYFEKIFVLFQRLHTREEYPGTGIGLALCKKIVERHGGRIWVESAIGRGSAFHFTLPGEDFSA